MTEKQVLNDAISFLTNQTTATVASTDEGKPWVATVFYVSDEQGNMYFLSGKSTRHSKEYIKNSAAAASVFDPKSSFGSVYGLQMEGEVIHCTAVQEIVEMGLAYVNKFPAAREEFLNPKDLVSAVFGSAFYKFVPKRLVFRTPEIKKETGKSTFEVVVKGS